MIYENGDIYEGEWLDDKPVNIFVNIVKSMDLAESQIQMTQFIKENLNKAYGNVKMHFYYGKTVVGTQEALKIKKSKIKV